jgi:hypothetical protein
MATKSPGSENMEKIGKTIATIVIVCLAAFFVYGYLGPYI